MARPLFNQIVTDVSNHDPFFRTNIDCAGRQAISGLLKCTSVIRQLAYGVQADFLDEYMQISERTSCTTLDHFCQAVMEIYGPEFLKKSAVTDIEKLYRHHEEKHRFPEMLGSFDCTDWEWFDCPSRTTTLTFYINHLYLTISKPKRASEIPFVANGVTYRSGYYLVYGIYPKLAPLVKTIPEPSNDDQKRILYKQKLESAKKDVERAFGVLKKK
ncbi:ALP1-like protein [Tanacetum coccineum]|uniref:ALP1-like protein n=1 Tax=Tanacetum coccineum TaxID=301880 RepID=A0ABQ5DS31_9ASTR